MDEYRLIVLEKLIYRQTIMVLIFHKRMILYWSLNTDKGEQNVCLVESN